MVLSRVGSVLLILLSLMSFGLVYALNADEKDPKPAFVSSIVNEILAAGIIPSPSNDDQNLIVASASASVNTADPLNEAINAAVFKRVETKDGQIRRILVVGRGETLTARLVMAGISRTEILTTLEALRPHINPRKIRDGQEVAVLFSTDGTNERYTGLELHDGLSVITISRNLSNSFQASLKTITPEKRRFAMRGSVRDSLYDSGVRLGIPSSVLSTIIKTYSHNIDFQRDVKEGDRFEVLYEQLVDTRGNTSGEATLIYAALQVEGKIVPIYRVATSGSSYEYFDARGESIRKGLLRTPVEGARITSGFGMRMHPLMGYSRMHKGVDFGVPQGSPIFAAGAGIIEEAERKSGYGMYVKIRHNNRVSTAYAHMSRYGRGITKGMRVAQGDVIGYVGSTGASTGPHLHYEVMVENAQVNPLSVDVPTGSSLAGKQLASFQEWRNKVHTQFEQIVAATSDPSRMAQNGDYKSDAR